MHHDCISTPSNMHTSSKEYAKPTKSTQRQSQEVALPLLGLLHLRALDVRLGLVRLILDLDGSVDGHLEDFINSSGFFRRALNVCGSHLSGNSLALLGSDGCQTLCAEEFDAGAFRTEVGFEAHENERSAGAEVRNFRVPLQAVSTVTRTRVLTYLVHHILQ